MKPTAETKKDKTTQTPLQMKDIEDVEELKLQMRLGQKEFEERFNAFKAESRKAFQEVKEKLQPQIQKLSLKANLGKMDARDLIEKEAKKFRKHLKEAMKDFKEEFSENLELLKDDWKDISDRHRASKKKGASKSKH